jgi:hypothetical protein
LFGEKSVPRGKKSLFQAEGPGSDGSGPRILVPLQRNGTKGNSDRLAVEPDQIASDWTQTIKNCDRYAGIGKPL